MSEVNNTNHLGNFVVHLHGACRHHHQGDLHDVWLNDKYSGQDAAGRWCLDLIHPRWCPQCIQQRSQAMFSRYEKRFEALQKSKAHEEKVWVETAYLRGVRDGRINALSMSFKRLPSRKEESKTSKDIDDISEMIEQLVLRCQDESPGESVERLATMMAQSDLTADERLERIPMYLKDEEAYECGLQEGMTEQAGMEWDAFFSEKGVREELFEMALA